MTPGNAEGLTREAREANVELGDIRLVDLRDVARNLGQRAEVGAIGLLSELVPLADEDRLVALAKGALEAQANAADAREQVDAPVDRHVPRMPSVVGG